jgi:acetyltransferase-like isoleucine patch superfamily enzyme
MAVELQRRDMRSMLAYYIQGQAAGPVDYLVQGLMTTLFGSVPGLLGLGLRIIAYRAIMRLDGAVGIEAGVRLRHARNIRLGRGVYLDQGVYLHATPGGISIGDRTCVMHGTELHVFNFRDLPHAYIKVGRDTFIGESVIIRGQGGVTIGDSVLIAPHARILAVNHGYGDLTRPIIEQGITCRGIEIADGAWIGAGAAVLDGVHVGRGAVVGANAVVTRDVAPHTIVVGSPARVARDLASPHQILRTA